MAGTSSRTRKLRWVALAGLAGAGVWLARSRRGHGELLRQWPAPDPAAPGAGGLTTGFAGRRRAAGTDAVAGGTPVAPAAGGRANQSRAAEDAAAGVAAPESVAAESVAPESEVAESVAPESEALESVVLEFSDAESEPVGSAGAESEPVVPESAVSESAAAEPTGSGPGGLPDGVPEGADPGASDPEAVPAELSPDPSSGHQPREPLHSLLSPPEPTPTDPSLASTQLPSDVSGEALFAPAASATTAARSGPRPSPSPRRRTSERTRDHGPGSAAPLPDGSAPGPEYTIKGNADSMLFHRPESPYYTRTKADLWFRTATDARAAGFTEWVPKDRRSE
jgi:hypothetical protein